MDQMAEKYIEELNNYYKNNEVDKSKISPIKSHNFKSDMIEKNSK